MQVLSHFHHQISTHSLTRRLTIVSPPFCTCAEISTHSLTRRLTFQQIFMIVLKCYFNSQPHKEADRIRQALTVSMECNFNSQPHKEADPSVPHGKSTQYISTHSLTRRLTCIPSNHQTSNVISTHSLTRRLTRSAANA